MRPYRGKRKDNGEWVYGYLNSPNRIMVWDNAVCMRSESYEVIPETVGQSTGKFNKDGKEEVFQGDLISFSTSKSQHHKGYIEWGKKSCSWLVCVTWEKQDKIGTICEGYELNYKVSPRMMRFSDGCFDVEIIGNIHDNEASNQGPEPAQPQEDGGPADS